MAERGLSNNLTTLLLGGGIFESLSSWVGEKAGDLHTRITGLRDDIEDLKCGYADGLEDPRQATEMAVTGMGVAAAHGAQQLASAHVELQAAWQYQAAFQIRHNIDRLPLRPDRTHSALLFGLLTIVEGVTTALFFLGGGFVSGVAQALALGLMISGVNVVVAGLIGGGVFGRYWNYGLKAREDDRLIGRKRLGGRIGAVLTALALAFLLLASGILRATGEPEALAFTFESIGAALTNFHSLMLWALGISFAVLSWRKGLSAFSDPYPGLSEASEVVGAAQEEIRAIHEEALEEIEDLYNEAFDTLAELGEEISSEHQAFRDQLRAIRHRREDILGAIAKAPSDFAAFKETQLTTQRMLGHGAPAAMGSVDEVADGFRSLEHLVPEIPVDLIVQDQTFQMERQEAGRRLACARIAALDTLNEAFRKALAPSA